MKYENPNNYALSYSSTQDRVSKCPKSLTSSLYAEQSYVEVEFPVILDDIFDENDVDEVLTVSKFFEKKALDKTKKESPSLWYRPAYYFDTKCETREILSREKVLQDLKFGIEELLNQARAKAASGQSWGLGRLFFFFFGPICIIGSVSAGGLAGPALLIFWILSAVMQIVNHSYLDSMRSDILKIIESITINNKDVNECISEDQWISTEALT